MEFFDALVRYEVALWSAVDEALQGAGTIHLGQLHALRMIDRRAGQARVQDLSDDIGITVGAASKLVDRIERDGLATRSPNPANRRSSLIALTPAGRRALRSALRVCDRAVAEAVGDRNVTGVTTALRRLQRQLDASREAAA